jgi:NAD(P)-dependent dehydrogenase (short-subunit alcohol dehydrogenase family)
VLTSDKNDSKTEVMTSVISSVLITGATGGVGSALVARLADRGWRVFAGARSPEAAARLAAGRTSVTPVELDVVNPASLAEARAVVTDHLRREGLPGLGGLVNNAGKSVDGPLELTPVQDLSDIFDVNVIGPIAVAQAFLPLLRSAHGRIVNIGGAAGRVAMPLYGALSASKAALDSISDILRMELLHQGVSVSYIEPGALETSFFARSADARTRTGYVGEAAAQAIYAPAITRASAAASAMKPGPLEPVIRTVERALTVQRPAPRYVVGRDAKAITTIVRRLPTRTRDKMIMRTMDLRPDAFAVPALVSRV